MFIFYYIFSFNYLLNFFLFFLFISFLFGRKIVYYLNIYDFSHNIRIDCYKYNKKKKNTPIMGGFILIVPIIFFIIFFFKKINYYVIIFLVYIFLNSLIGFIDDYMKIYYNNFDGLSLKIKYFFQSLFAFIYIFFLNNKNFFNLYNFKISLFKKNINILFIYYIFIYFLLVGITNSFNISDGMDGLVIFPSILIVLFLFILSFISSSVFLSSFLNIIYIDYSYVLVLINLVFLSSLLIFFLFNFYPADVFLGDLGSLFLGSYVSSMFILLKKEFYLILLCFPFILEVFSVILQVLNFKIFKKRLFLMSPLHHHFYLLGYSEIKVVVFFWFFSLILLLVGFLFLFKF